MGVPRKEILFDESGYNVAGVSGIDGYVPSLVELVP